VFALSNLQAVGETLYQTSGALMATIAQTWVEQGMERAARGALLDILTIRFAAVPQDVAQAITQVGDPARLGWLRKEALTATSLTEFEQAMEA